ncbi:hypothetical protein [Streptomyces sp. NPDC085540]|uniref:hypothetical protein n=1 Tax=Streptomyces sp. NPDC085540 TaxID=3365730 RepID=UPI0037D1E45B
MTVKVADIGESERTACPGKVAALPSEQLEEPWPAGGSWPQSPWDVRAFRPGEKVTPAGSDADLGYGDTLTSAGFTEEVVMSGAKAVVMATAVVRCDAQPRLFEVRWVGRSEVWARYRVAPIDEVARRARRGQEAKLAGGQPAGRAAWLVGAAAALVAAGAGDLCPVPAPP